MFDTFNSVDRVLKGFYKVAYFEHYQLIKE